MTYLISCSGKKSMPAKEFIQKSSLEKINGFPKLYEARKELIAKLGIELNWNETCPAYKLYGGKIYSKINLQNWEKKETDVIIVSALFGLIKHDDLIPNYDVIINSQIPKNGGLISSYWRSKNIVSFINLGESTDLLFSKYRLAFSKIGSDVGILPNCKWRDNYGSHKGEWLNDQLDKL